MVLATSVSMAIAYVTSWFTPTFLFCAANLIIATIFIFSKNNHNHQPDNNNNSSFSRVSSFLHRATSFNNSSPSSYSATITTAQPETPPKYNSLSRLAQSIHHSESSPSQLARPPSFVERVKSFRIFSTTETDPRHYEEHNVTQSKSNSLSQLARPPSFVERVKSFRIFDLGTTPIKPETAETDPRHNPEHNVTRSKSDNNPKTKRKKKKLVEMKKSRSEMRMVLKDEEDEVDVDERRPATAREHEVEEEVDARADDFINRFKQQLKLQRIESLVRYKEMLNRRMP